jgi:hypothetical protein
MSNSIIWENKLVALRAKGLSFDEFKTGRHAEATFNAGTISTFA